jgi:YjbE family integral membrane protein
MWDLGWFGHISFDWAFLSGLLSVIMIDLILAGDNAVVIAMAVRLLPKKQRMWGIILGAGAAVMLRVVCTFFVAQMVKFPLLKFLGGALIAWIAVKLLVEGAEEKKIGEAGTLWQAVRLIVVADIIMSVDNMLAVAGASKGNFFLLLFGLGLSIPFVVGTSTLLSLLMDRYPIIPFIGSAILGKVAGEMMITDPMVHRILQPPHYLEYVVEALFAVGVIVVGKILLNRKKAKAEASPAGSEPIPVSGKK